MSEWTDDEALFVEVVRASGRLDDENELAEQDAGEMFGEVAPLAADEAELDAGCVGAALAYVLTPAYLSPCKLVDEADGNQWEPFDCVWPLTWDSDLFTPSDRRSDLVRAAALLLAEVRRRDRVARAARIAVEAAGGVQ